MSVVDHTTLNSWYRWWHHEDRFRSLEAIYSIVEEATRYIDTLTEPEQNEMKRILLLAFTEAKVGISSLLETYHDDPKLRSKVNTLLQEMELVIKKNQSRPLTLSPWLRCYTPPTPLNMLTGLAKADDDSPLD
jgi:hypothetical protein